MTLIQRSRFADSLTRFFGLNSSNPAPELGSQILPTINVLDADPALFYLRSEKLCTGSDFQGPPGGGNYSWVGLLNPTGSGLLAIVDTLYMYASVATDLVLHVGPAAVGPGTLGIRRATDLRWTNMTPVCTVNGVSQATDPFTLPATATKYYTLAAGEKLTVPSPRIILTPGNTLWIGAGVVATPIIMCTFDWRERSLPSEESTLP